MDQKVCKVCGYVATQVFVNGHKERRYALCDSHFETVCSVRIVATQHEKKIKRVNRKNVALDDKKYCGVRFIFLFREVASVNHFKDRGRYASSAVPLGEAYNILQKRRSTNIYLSGKNGIATM